MKDSFPSIAFFMKIKNDRRCRIIFRIISATLILILAYIIIPVGLDWQNGFRPAGIAFLNGKSPYEAGGTGFFNPPWALIFIVPLTLLPSKISSFLITVSGFFAYIYIIRRLGGGKVLMLALMMSPTVALDLAYANFNWLVFLGYFLPPWIGLFLVTLKPQMSIGIIIFWLVRAWQEGGIRRTFVTIFPIILAYIVSFIFFDLWILKSIDLSHETWNTSMWPLSIPIGVVLLVKALRDREIKYSYMVGPFLSPYVAIYSWTTVLLGLFPNTYMVITAVVSIWATYLYITRFTWGI